MGIKGALSYGLIKILWWASYSRMRKVISVFLSIGGGRGGWFLDWKWLQEYEQKTHMNLKKIASRKTNQKFRGGGFCFFCCSIRILPKLSTYCRSPRVCIIPWPSFKEQVGFQPAACELRCWWVFDLSSDPLTPGYVCCIWGMTKVPSFMGIKINRYKDPCKPISLIECCLAGA